MAVSSAEAELCYTGLMNIQTLPINKINPAAYNPRTMNEDEFAGLVHSLKTFGQVENLIVNKDGTLISGHMRLEAAKHLGWTDMTCNVIDVDKATEKKLNVVMNSQAISGRFDDLKLSELLEELKLDPDYLPLRLNELEPLDLSEPEIEEDDAPEVSTEPPVSKLGEVYQLGRHLLMCGDATSSSDIEKLMDGSTADMVFTDPPYGVGYQSNMRTKSPQFAKLDNDDTLLTGWIEPVARVSNGFIFVWTSWKVAAQWQAICAAFGALSNVIVWDKGGGGIGDLEHTFSTDYELALVYGRGKAITGKRIGSVWDIGKDGALTYEHPTQKPVALAAMAITHTTKRGAVVLDVFGGSGSTLMACEQTGRMCLMMELDPKYCDVIRRRYHKLVSGNDDGWELATPALQPV